MNLLLNPIAFLFLFIHFPFTLQANPLPNTLSLNPLILLKEGKVGACGFTLRATPSDNLVTGELRVEHQGGQNIFSVRARSEQLQKEGALSDLRLTTQSLDTRTIFPKVQIDKEGYLLLQSALNDSIGAQLMQEILVSGGVFHLTTQGGKTLTIELPHPLSHSLRLAYLSCAGDLIGPEPE